VMMWINTGEARPYVVYGEDHRHDTIVASSFHQELAQSGAAMILKNQMMSKGKTTELNGPSLGKRFNLCHNERFFFQPSVAYCSGFLVAPDLIATAGHCVQNMVDCKKASWVFNYKVNHENDSSVTVLTEEIYNCASIVKQENGGPSQNDYALIKLDRKVQGHTPVKIARTEPEVGEPLIMIGHPSGLPQKIDDGGSVIQKIATGFRANLDAFQINSGSAIFHSQTGELVGILVNGAQDYRKRVKEECDEVNVMQDQVGSEGVSSFKQFAQYITSSQ